MWLVAGFYHPAMPSASIGYGTVLLMTMAIQLNDREKLAKKPLSFSITMTLLTQGLHHHQQTFHTPRCYENGLRNSKPPESLLKLH